jgi:hypothetical protein
MVRRIAEITPTGRSLLMEAIERLNRASAGRASVNRASAGRASAFSRSGVLCLDRSF